MLYVNLPVKPLFNNLLFFYEKRFKYEECADNDITPSILYQLFRYSILEQNCYIPGIDIQLFRYSILEQSSHTPGICI